MKRIVPLFALGVLSLAVFLTFTFSTCTVLAQSAGYHIENIDHQMEVMYSGHIIIRDTIHVTGQLTDGFLIGFPKKYGAHVLKGVAYDENYVLPMSLDVAFEGHNEIYGARINFPQGNPQIFTVTFVLSNNLIHQNTSLSAVAVEFPAYPSVAKKAARCNVTLTLPDFASGVKVSKDDGSAATTNFVKEDLAAFTKSQAVVSFSMPAGILQIFTVTNLDRVTTISPAGDVVAFDSYRIKNNSNDSLVAFGADVPLDAANLVGRDEFGKNLMTEILGTGSTFHLVNVTLIQPLTKGQSTTLTVEYTLPRLSSEQLAVFALDFDLFPYLDYYVKEGAVTIIPPEGALFLHDHSASLNKNGFQEILTFNKEGICHIDLDVPSDSVQIKYTYNPLWLSFRPTMWVWLLVTVGCMIVALWKRPNISTSKIAVSKTPIDHRSDRVRAFTEDYEEKNRITFELGLLDAKARKGKIPRRQYKKQLRKLEARSSIISKDIAESKGVFLSAGGNYASLIRQLDGAETELKTVERKIKDAEARNRSGVTSSGEYKKELADYQQRKDNSEALITGILLRLREETR